MRYLSEADLTNLVAPQTLIAGIERGLLDLLEQKVILRPRDHMAFDDSTLLTMPIVGAEAFGAKIVAVHPSNGGRGLPVVNGLMTLFERHTGLPRAIINAAVLTAQRTAAVGAVGLKYTTPPDLERLGVVGTGVQGTWLAIFACAVRPIRTIYFLNPSDERATAFVDAVSRHHPKIRLARCTDSSLLVSQSQAVITATTSNSPVLPNDRRVLENRHLLSVGSFKPTMQELPDAAFELTRQVVVDSDIAKDEVGDLRNPISAGTLHAEDLIQLADLVAGRKTLALDTTTIFKSVGMALYDLYAAQLFCDAAEATNRGTKLDR